MKLSELLCDIPYRTASDAMDTEVTKIITSARTGLENALFVCSKASLRDSADEMRVAYQAGCRFFVSPSAISPGHGSTTLIIEEPDRYLGMLAARMHGHPARQLSVLGITGALHATRTALLLEQVLRRAGVRVAALSRAGRMENGRLIPPSPLLPDAAAIQGYLADQARAGTEVVILELTAHQLAHFAAESIPFAAVLLTDDTFEPSECRGFCGSAAFFAAQERLLSNAAPFVVLPAARKVDCKGRALRIGQELQALSRAPYFDKRTGYGTRFALHIEGERAEVALPLLGEFSVDAALGAAALARIVGVKLATIAAGLGEAQLAGYTEFLPLPYGRCAYIDAAYSPAGIAEVLRSLRAVCGGRLSVLLGSVGGRAKERRIPLGRVAQSYADHIYLSADDPDAEDPAAICADILQGITDPERVTVIPDRSAAILRAVRELRPDDILLLAGKGSDARQLIGGVHHPFCERDIVNRVKF